MLASIPLDTILFLDIETVPEHRSFDDLDEVKKSLWELKTQYQRKEEESASDFYRKAGIWAEFGRVICISAGYFYLKGPVRNFRVTTFKGEETAILEEFRSLLNTHFNLPRTLLCAHNGKEFDFPYLARRMIINNIALPDKLNLFGKKPWEVAHLDTMDLWKFGDYKHYTSLKLLSHVLGIPSPKEDMDGSMVRDVFYEDGDLQRIISYCELDVITLAQVMLRLRNERLLSDEEVIRI